METEIIFKVILFSVAFYLPLGLFAILAEYADVYFAAACSTAFCVFVTHKLCAPVPRKTKDDSQTGN